MRRKPERQVDFAEAFLPEEVGHDEVLERVDALVDWSALEALNPPRNPLPGRAWCDSEVADGTEERGMRRDVERQRDFAEAFLPEEAGRDDVLERVDALIDWPALEAVCGDVYAAPVGRPSYPLIVLIKAMLVQAWWNLSDPKAEQLLRNDLRFRRFLGVGLTGKTPDQNTLWRFDAVASPSARDGLAKRGLAEALLAEVDRQLRARGLVLRRGSIVDATLVRSAASSKNRRKDGRPVDPDADRAARSGRDPTLGDMLHAAVDEDTGIVRRIALTPASRHERTVAEAVLPEDVGRVWADAAYDARDLRDGLGARGIAPVIAHNPRRRGLRPWQRAVNVVVKTVRPRIEPVFGTLKRSCGLARARGFSLARNLVDTTFRVLAFDLRRAVTLSPPVR